MKLLLLLSSVLFASVFCFHISTDEIISGRIIGGNETEPFVHPYQCSLQIFAKGRYDHLCGATILDENNILTAAHCTDDLDLVNETVEVWCGKWDLTKVEPSEQRRNVSSYVQHENWGNWSYPGWFLSDWDISLIHLDRPLNFSRYVQAVTLPPADLNPFIVNNATLIGWGAFYANESFESDVADRLRYVDVPLISNEICLSLVEPLITSINNNVCTGPVTGGYGGCSGDSGGPMMQTSGNSTYQIGIASWAIRPCGSENGPTGYVLVHKFLKWIHAHVV